MKFQGGGGGGGSSQLVPIFGQLVPDLWSTQTYPKSTRTRVKKRVGGKSRSYHAFLNALKHHNLLRLGKSLKPTILASFSYNSFKRLANWSLEDMFFGNNFKSLRVAPPPFYNTHENVRLMSTVSYILSAPSRLVPLNETYKFSYYRSYLHLHFHFDFFYLC